MANHQQLNFLREKIQEIGSAIFYNQSDSVVKLPTSIVSSLKTDEYGYVWFFVQKPKQSLRFFEQEFPARLDFFRKGSNCFLQISGKGYVVSDPEEINAYTTLPEEKAVLLSDTSVLVKVKILKAEYFESRTQQRHNWLTTAFSAVTNLFGQPTGFGRPNTVYPAS